MSNYIEYKEKIAFHPGYYIKELVEESGLTQEDYAKRLGTTPKNLSCLIRGEQTLSNDIAGKLSRMLGTSVEYWLNIQKEYDVIVSEIMIEKELEEERKVLKSLGYKYFRDNFYLPDIPRRLDEQVERVRYYLNLGSLTNLRNRDMTVSFRSAEGDISEDNVIRANAMVQIASNMAMKTEAPKYERRVFKEAAEKALELTVKENFYDVLQELFRQAGVILVVLPNIPGSKVSGATKRVGNNILLMINDRRMYTDTFWFTLYHEIGHILKNEYGISEIDGKEEDIADDYARNILIPEAKYESFVKDGNYGLASIQRFAAEINRNPAIILGRLQNDNHILYSDVVISQKLRKRYKVICT